MQSDMKIIVFLGKQEKKDRAARFARFISIQFKRTFRT